MFCFTLVLFGIHITTVLMCFLTYSLLTGFKVGKKKKKSKENVPFALDNKSTDHIYM